VSKVYHRSQRDDWETPPALFNLLDREFAFNLDVCANPLNRKCRRFFYPPLSLYLGVPHCLPEDGLKQSWQGATCWMNPPYSQTRAWLEKAWAEVAQGGAMVVCLVAARTDTVIWHECIFPHATEIRFLRGRVKFVGGEAGAPFPSAIVVFWETAPEAPRIEPWDWRAAAAKEQADEG
jgi:phage N-6-adenine-methyltransferase